MRSLAFAVYAVGSACSGALRKGRVQLKGAGLGLEPATFSFQVFASNPSRLIR